MICYADDTALLSKGGTWDKVFYKAEWTMQLVKIGLDSSLLTPNIKKLNSSPLHLTKETTNIKKFKIYKHVT